MTTTEEGLALWERLKNYSLDKPEHHIAISTKIAREHHWDLPYTKRVIEEYKKFVFLALTAGHLVVPSDEVDQVWHMHMLYTDEYWNVFCKEVLGRPLHHGPSTGGKQEHDKHTNWYKKTKETYQQVFEQPVPLDIWPSSHLRFNERYVRINVHSHIVIEKTAFPLLSQLVITLFTWNRKKNTFIQNFKKVFTNEKGTTRHTTGSQHLATQSDGACDSQ